MTLSVAELARRALAGTWVPAAPVPRTAPVSSAPVPPDALRSWLAEHTAPLAPDERSQAGTAPATLCSATGLGCSLRAFGGAMRDLGWTPAPCKVNGRVCRRYRCRLTG